MHARSIEHRHRFFIRRAGAGNESRRNDDEVARVTVDYAEMHNPADRVSLSRLFGVRKARVWDSQGSRVSEIGRETCGRDAVASRTAAILAKSTVSFVLVWIVCCSSGPGPNSCVVSITGRGRMFRVLLEGPQRVKLLVRFSGTGRRLRGVLTMIPARRYESFADSSLDPRVSIDM